MADTTLLMRLDAEKSANVDRTLGDLQADVSKVKTSFSTVATQADALNQVIAKLAGTAEKFGAAFERGAAKAKPAISEAVKQAQALDKAMSGTGSSLYAQPSAPKPIDFKAIPRPGAGLAGGGLIDKSIEETKRLVAEQAAAAKAAADVIAAAERQKQEALKATRDEFDKNTAKAKELGPAILLGLGGAAAALTAISKNVLEVANSFEKMKAQLTTIQGSSAIAEQTFQRAQKFAANSPFDLEGVVRATVQIETYGQRSEQVLPRVAALAAGMNRDLGETSLVVGKALSGSLEGFESLRNTYGITTRELARFGAETTKTGGILVQTAAQAQKANSALLQIIDLKYGDAVERQSQTLAGQLEKVADGAKTLAGEVGVGAAGVVKLGASFVGGGFDLLNKIPSELKAAAGAALVLGAGLTTVAAGVATVGAGLVFLVPRIVAANSAFIAMGGAQGALFILEQRCNALGITAIPRIATAFASVAGPVALITGLVAGLAAAAGAVTLATNLYIDAQKRLQAELKADSLAFEIKIKQQKDLADAIKRVREEEEKRTGVATRQPEGPSTSESRIADLKKIVESASTADFFKNFKEKGYDPERVKGELKGIPDAINVSTDKVKKLQEELKTAKEYAESDRTDLLGNRLTRDPKDVERDLQAAQSQLDLEKEREAQLKLIQERYEKNAVSLEKVGTAAKSADDYLKYADKAGDIASMTGALDTLKDKVGQAGAALRELNEPTDRESLLAKLQSGVYNAKGNEELLEQVKAYLDGLDDIEKRQKAIDKERDENTKGRISKLQQDLAEEQSLRKVSAREELENLAQQEAEAKKLGEAGASERIRINTQKAAANQRIREYEVAQEKKAAEASLKAVLKVDVAAKTADKGTQAAVDAYDKAIKRTEDWIKANGDLIAKFSELGTQSQAALDSLKVARAAAETARLAKNFDDVKDSIKELEDAAKTTSEKLAAVGRAQELVKNARGAKKISEEQATDTDRTLKDQKTTLEEQKKREDLQHQQELTQLKQQAAEQDLAIAQTLGDGTQRSYDKILLATEKLYQFKLKALQDERDAAIANNQDKLQAEERYQAAVANLEKQKVADFHANAKAQVDAERQKLLDIINLNKTQKDATKTGLNFGVATKDAGVGFSLGGGSAEEDAKRRETKRAKDQLAKLDAKEAFRKANPELAAKVAEEDYQRKLKAADPSGVIRNVNDKFAKSEADAAAQGAGPKNVTDNRSYNLNLTMQGGGVANAEIPLNSALGRAIVKLVEDKFQDESYRDGGQGTWP